MRLATFRSDKGPALGVIVEDRICPVAELDADIPSSIRGLIASGPATLNHLRNLVGSASGDALLGLDDVALLPVILDAPKIICVGLNYADHAKEGGNKVPDYPALFLRTNRSMIGAGAPIVKPNCSDTLDYEAELMLIIGKEGRHVRESDALDYVFGYSIFNDGSVREFQRKASQWTPGKNFDDTGPVGPWIVTADELPPGASGLKIESRLNGKVMQSSNTANMIVSVPRIIELLSEVMTLEPGDMIAMGTPEGVGYARTPPTFMQPGDVIEIEIEGLGVLTNPITAERISHQTEAAE
ncbi:MAG: fumarylacetoacetate hydrolase family protein [Hyphomicrobiaceae bacterium]